MINRQTRYPSPSRTAAERSSQTRTKKHLPNDGSRDTSAPIHLHRLDQRQERACVHYSVALIETLLLLLKMIKCEREYMSAPPPLCVAPRWLCPTERG